MEFLGVIDKKEYYLDDEGAIVYRVPDIRESVRAPQGRRIFSADFSQIEVRIMTLLSQDPFLTAAINSGKDIHSYMACEIFSLDYNEFYAGVKDKKHPKHDEYVTLRSNTKTTTFGVPYGAGPSRVALMTGLSLDAAKEFIEAYFVKAWKLKEWLDELRKDAVSDRNTRSAKGRIRWYEIPPRSDQNYKKIISQIGRFAGNMPIQATCVDILKPALVKFYTELRGGDMAMPRIHDAQILLAVHDEIVCEGSIEAAGPDSKNLGPASLLLKQSMEWAYNQIYTDVKVMDPITDKWVTERHWLYELGDQRLSVQERAGIDVVVNDYWSKD